MIIIKIKYIISLMIILIKYQIIKLYHQISQIGLLGHVFKNVKIK
jgi:hypothetical protein